MRAEAPFGQPSEQFEMVGLSVVDLLERELELQARDPVPGDADAVEDLVLKALRVGFDEHVFGTGRAGAGEAIDAGVSELLRKPLDLAALDRAVRGLLPEG